VQGIGQFMGVIAIGRLVDEGFYSSQQGAVAGEPNPFMRPQSAIVEVSVGEGCRSGRDGCSWRDIEAASVYERR
jgi:hypothetical protein